MFDTTENITGLSKIPLRYINPKYTVTYSVLLILQLILYTVPISFPEPFLAPLDKGNEGSGNEIDTVPLTKHWRGITRVGGRGGVGEMAFKPQYQHAYSQYMPYELSPVLLICILIKLHSTRCLNAWNQLDKY